MNSLSKIAPFTCESLQDLCSDIRLETSKSSYERQLKKLQQRMVALQQAYWHEKRKVIIVFEGCDASGKGGAIRRLTEKLDPRSCQVHPISAPTQEELAFHYLCRFQTKLPAAGSIAVFDRSWYGRLLVERVEGFAKKEQWKRAYKEINQFEKMQYNDGTRIVKLFMNISSEEQLKRFKERLNNPLKRWKLTPEDLRNRSKWKAYQVATDDMLRLTSTNIAPWYVIPANHKWYTRLAVLHIVIDALSLGIDTTPPSLDPAFIEMAQHQLGI